MQIMALSQNYGPEDRRGKCQQIKGKKKPGTLGAGHGDNIVERDK